MVLTRNQERSLMQQYHVPAAGEAPSTPRTPKEVVLPDGRHLKLKSALKAHTRARPWESDEEEYPATAATPVGAGIKKRVRIHSRDNMVHVFALSREGSMGATDSEEESTSPHRSSARRRRPHRRRSVRSGLRHAAGAMRAGVALLGWAISSSWLIFLMRDLIRYKGLPLPFMLPAVSQLGCALMAWTFGALNMATIRPWTWRQFSRTLAPLTLTIVASMCLGNFAFIGLTLSFLNILKAMTPAVTLLISAGAGVEPLTPTAFFATLLIAYGTGVATEEEMSSGRPFHWASFLSFSLSVVFEGLRVVQAAKLLGGMKKPYTPVEMLAHQGVAVFLLTAATSLTLERPALAALTRDDVMSAVPDLCLVCVLSFVVNISSYYAIRLTSSTTFKVAGCFKNAAVVWAATLGGDSVTPMQWQGLAVSSAGFLLYTWAKSRREVVKMKTT